VALFHGHLKKVRVMLKVYRVSELVGNERRVHFSRKMSRDFIFLICKRLGLVSVSF
jgi:hypothetical protein